MEHSVPPTHARYIVVGFLGSLAGCELIHSHGICDCEEDNHCAERSPWVQFAAPSTIVSEPIKTAPAKLPDTPKKNL